MTEAHTTIEVFSQSAAELRELIDRELAVRCQLPEDCPAGLSQAMAYALLAPGKRLRPMLVLHAAEACQGTLAAAMPAACAVEMVHAYSLVHDDLPAMDDDDLRRGLPTCHKKFGEALAILAGDGLLTQAFEVLATQIQPPSVAARCCGVLARAAGPCNMVGGQADDMDSHHAGGDLDGLCAIHRRKTGAMIEASLELGGLAADADDDQLAALRNYGRCLGLAFQITDDLLDVRSNAQAVGKRTGKDAQRGKLTFPGLLGIEQSDQRARQLVAEACTALAPFNGRAERLEALARYVVERNR